MGKNLIIKGANFTENCINPSSLVLDRTQQFNYAVTVTAPSAGPFADLDYAQLENHVITSLEFIPAQEGIISITKSTAVDSGGHEVVAQVNVLPEHVGFVTRYYIGNNIQVNAGEILAINVPNDSGMLMYIRDTDEYAGTRTGLYTRVGTEKTVKRASFCLTINWYGYSL